MSPPAELAYHAGRALSRALGVAACAALVLATATADAEADDAPPKQGVVRPAHLEDVEHMCSLLTGCAGLPIPEGLVPRDFATCVRAMYAELASSSAIVFPLTLRECGLHASSCSALRTCALRGAQPNVCAGRGRDGPADMCDSAGRAITCANERVTLVRDCPRGGEQCLIRGGKASCALGACDKDTPPACSNSGTRILECKGGKLSSLDCAALGLRCVTTADGPRCATAAAACKKGDHRCDGAVAVGCHEGHEVRVDCASVGMSCQARGAGVDVGECAQAKATSGCDDRAPAKCDKSTVRYCMGGRPRAYLCKSMGFARCATDARGAHCAP